jgi:hypothetical protein
MQTDIILEDATNYQIVDAKYYSAKSAASSPGWPDIAKQMFYEKALHELISSEMGLPVEIRSIFAFPSQLGGGPLDRVQMRNSAGQMMVGDFPQIECAYIPIRKALKGYVEGAQTVNIGPAKTHNWIYE